jgi:small subunit ribosomal protein S5
MTRQDRDRDRNSKKEQSEFDEKVLFVNRCTKVLKGGRKFSFSALILVGDKKGRVGFGFAKANELSDAIKKGGELAKKDLRTFERDGTSIPHEVVVDWDGARVLLKPAPAGTGVIAGSRIRAVLEIAGVKDIVAKSLGSNNPINQVRATFKALASLRNREESQKIRGLA